MYLKVVWHDLKKKNDPDFQTLKRTVFMFLLVKYTCLIISQFLLIDTLVVHRDLFECEDYRCVL